LNIAYINLQITDFIQILQITDALSNQYIRKQSVIRILHYFI